MLAGPKIVLCRVKNMLAGPKIVLCRVKNMLAGPKIVLLGPASICLTLHKSLWFNTNRRRYDNVTLSPLFLLQ
jgi:hypothetical protein